MVILSIYAFDEGGASAVGLAAGLRLLPAAALAPAASCSSTATHGVRC
jgi:hypothetical protein